MENSIWKPSDEEFVNLVKSSCNISEILFKLGLTVKGNSWGYSQVKNRMSALKLTYGDFKGRSALKMATDSQKIENKDLFKEQKKHARNIVRNRIIKDNLLEYKCAICGISEWNGKKLSLELDHINGINYDNRLENLRFLCPNCHSQTTTYGARNSQLSEPKYDITPELEQLVIETYKKEGTIKKTYKALNIRKVIVNKIISTYGLTKKTQKYVIQKDLNGNELTRFGSINEASKWLKDNGYLTGNSKTIRATFLRNTPGVYKGFIWEILDE